MIDPTCSSKSLLFPSNGYMPKAAIFLRCTQSHVFSFTGLADGTIPADDDICYIFGPCPKCPLTSVYPFASAPRKCPFCDEQMGASPYGQGSGFKCQTDTCWLSHSVDETGTPSAVKLWATALKATGGWCFYGTRDDSPVGKADTQLVVNVEDAEAAHILLNMMHGKK